jgi:hypothetical protein
MSDIFIQEIQSENNSILEVESGSMGDITHITVEVINTEFIQISDLPDNIPLSKISGLDAYLDNYQFDCGTP